MKLLNDIWEHFDQIADGAPDASYRDKKALEFAAPLKRYIYQHQYDEALMSEAANKILELQGEIARLKQ